MGKLAVAVITSLWVIPISLMVNKIVPEPYMDEIFHIPQAQQYCRGNFRSWDPMITTPPGLYYISLAHVASLFPGLLFIKQNYSFSEFCSSSILRSLNGFLAVICSILVYEILTQLRPDLDEKKATLRSIVLSLYPLHWFFTFLYYTDVASLTLVLAMYLLCLKRHYQLSSLFGALAILIRQTNVVWVLLVACIGVINFTKPRTFNDSVHMRDYDVSSKKNDGLVDTNMVPADTNLRKRKMGSSVNAINHSMSKIRDSSSCCTSGLIDEIRDILVRLWHLKWEFLVSFGSFFLVLVVFVMFVIWNGSVVLGAKEAHTVSPHLAQMMYFGLVSAFAMAPFHFSFSEALNLYQSFWENKPLSFVQVFIVLSAGFLSVHFFSIAHPYLLADNRHYTFYIWRKVVKFHWLTKYLLVPIYVYSWFSIFNILGKTQKKLWMLLFFLACGAVLIPAPLIEFRYYTIPFYFLALHTQLDNNTYWLFMGIAYTTVDIFTMMMFLFRPFHWAHEVGTQRFIW
ncbi:hypothetical protein GIB67_040481 [Kingdonia uniflora]|uniref:Dol-P-Glc:Glc(2)Man(9)GlcNAc(2)-PP-Dol alpha-1,2-glucosyltransferase n=1 Tax=Kingdonia uniflora TaxID=39325 RepID=A0A7J7L596_9MAGN|nr:hypothetical protein GIB67_040481 [Kingdonia uniflora]